MLPFTCLVQSEMPFWPRAELRQSRWKGFHRLWLGFAAELAMEVSEADVCLRLGFRGPQVASPQGPLTHVAVRAGGHFWGTMPSKASGSLVAA